MRLVRVYLDRLPEEIVDGYASLLGPHSLQELVFAWADPPEPRAPHYYRVQSDDFLIEYDCTQNDASHIHSELRNPRGDFGSDPLMAWVESEQQGERRQGDEFAYDSQREQGGDGSSTCGQRAAPVGQCIGSVPSEEEGPVGSAEGDNGDGAQTGPDHILDAEAWSAVRGRGLGVL